MAYPAPPLQALQLQTSFHNPGPDLRGAQQHPQQLGVSFHQQPGPGSGYHQQPGPGPGPVHHGQHMSHAASHASQPSHASHDSHRQRAQHISRGHQQHPAHGSPENHGGMFGFMSGLLGGHPHAQQQHAAAAHGGELRYHFGPKVNQPKHHALPLLGVRVLEVGKRTWSSALCGQMLAACGADVVRVAFGKEAEAMRAGGHTKDMDLTDSAVRSQMDEHDILTKAKVHPVVPPELHVGKRLAPHRPDHPHERDAMHPDLLAGADILLTDLPITELDELGFSYETVHLHYPNIIYAHISSIGATADLSQLGVEDAGAYYCLTGIAKELEHYLGPRGVPAASAASSLFGTICIGLMRRRSGCIADFMHLSIFRCGKWAATLGAVTDWAQPPKPKGHDTELAPAHVSHAPPFPFDVEGAAHLTPSKDTHDHHHHGHEHHRTGKQGPPDHFTWRWRPQELELPIVLPDNPMNAELPLSRVSVIEISDEYLISAAAVGRLLVDLGAQVTKVERPSRPDPWKEKCHDLWDALNRGKTIDTVDYAHVGGAAAMYRSLAQATMLLTNLPARALDAWGFNITKLREMYPHLVIVIISTWGVDATAVQHEHRGGRKGGEEVAAFWEASGLKHRCFNEMIMPPGISELSVAQSAIAGIGLALLRQQRTNSGQLVHCGRFQTGFYARMISEADKPSPGSSMLLETIDHRFMRLLGRGHNPHDIWLLLHSLGHRQKESLLQKAQGFFQKIMDHFEGWSWSEIHSHQAELRNISKQWKYEDLARAFNRKGVSWFVEELRPGQTEAQHRQRAADVERLRAAHAEKSQAFAEWDERVRELEGFAASLPPIEGVPTHHHHHKKDGEKHDEHEQPQHKKDGETHDEDEVEWIKEDGIPDNEGKTLDLDLDGRHILEIQAECEAHPDCVGFAYCPADGSRHALEKGTGFNPGTSKYTQKHDGEHWETHYILSRAKESLPPGIFGSFLHAIGLGGDKPKTKARQKASAKERAKKKHQTHKHRTQSDASPQDNAQLARSEQQQQEHYMVAVRIQEAKQEKELLDSELAHITHDYELAEHALQWLQQRDGLSPGMFMPESIEDRSWLEACGGNIMLQSPVMVIPGRSNIRSMTKPMKPHHIALFPDLYAQKPKLKIIIRGAQNLRRDHSSIEKPHVYCVCEIPGNPKSRFKTPSVETLSPNWNHEQRVPSWEPGNSLSFSVFKAAPIQLQRGTVVRTVGMDNTKLNGAVGRCQEFDVTRGMWIVAFEDKHTAPIKEENLEVTGPSAGKEELLGWCQIPSKKFTPDGFDGVVDLTHSGSTGALLRVHIDPQDTGGVLLNSEYVSMLPDGDHGSHHAGRDRSASMASGRARSETSQGDYPGLGTVPGLSSGSLHGRTRSKTSQDGDHRGLGGAAAYGAESAMGLGHIPEHSPSSPYGRPPSGTMQHDPGHASGSGSAQGSGLHLPVNTSGSGYAQGSGLHLPVTSTGSQGYGSQGYGRPHSGTSMQPTDYGGLPAGHGTADWETEQLPSSPSSSRGGGNRGGRSRA